MSFICFNGKFLSAKQPVLMFDNRGYRYGDGFFETIKLTNGKIPLLPYHLQRIENSFELLNYHPASNSIQDIVEEILELCKLNKCGDAARVRLSFSNGSGSAFDNNMQTDYIIEASPLNNHHNLLNKEGITIGTCPLIKKSCDVYANLKSANYLPSRVAIEFAKKNHWDDALILNQHNHIAESTIANIFWIKNDTIFTPALSEGCVDGVFRKYVIEQVKLSSTHLLESVCTKDILLDADEIFLTNAVIGIRWVKFFGNKEYENKQITTLYNTSITG